MAKLGIEIIADEQDPWSLLAKLAKAKFGASKIHKLDGTNTINIDNGANDIRGLIRDDVIEFYCRYEDDSLKYEKAILEFCRESNLTIRFCEASINNR
ncbi:hypothetical protein [Alteromonas sp. S015]|uniref:hypothetical protein n=1 Tax=Alteromonas sp. S015 TaxID=3117401 RepID=UPI002FE051CC